jgi:hypothetical protein
VKLFYAILGEGRPAKRRRSDCMAEIFEIEDKWGLALREKRRADWQEYEGGFKELAAACAIEDTEAIAAYSLASARRLSSTSTATTSVRDAR